MNNNVVLLPVILPMAAAILMMFFHKQVRLQRWLSGLCAIALLIASGYLLQRAYTGEILVFCASGWQPPYGITLVVDLFSAIMVVLTAIACLACLLFAFRSIDREREANYFYPVWFLLMMGVNGSLITGDIFNLFVFFEILLMASYVLMVDVYKRQHCFCNVAADSKISLLSSNACKSKSAGFPWAFWAKAAMISG